MLGLTERGAIASDDGRVTILEADDSVAVTAKPSAAGAEVVAEPTRTAWNSLNSRLKAPGALQLTLFSELDG